MSINPEERIKSLTVEYLYAKMAQINISELMTAVKVAPSYKEMVESQTSPDILVPNYINERDYFGKRPYLNKNAILLYIYLHFINPDASGRVKFAIKPASDFLSLPAKTIRFNLRNLLRHGYIQYINDEIGVYTIYINGYSEKGQTASDGFKGYFNVTLDTFKELIKVSSINELRIQLRGLMQCCPGINNGRLEHISFSDIKRFFPSYIHIKDIKHLLVTDLTLTMFNVKFTADEKFCMIKAKDNYDPVKVKNGIVSDCEQKVKKLVKKMLSQKKHAATALLFSDKNINDISKISLRLPIDDILCGIESLFENYSGARVSNIGGLVRVLSQEHYDNRIIVSSQ